MAHHDHDESTVQNRLWHEIEKHGLGMLGVTAEPAQHFQPMSPFVERETRQIWFFTYKDTDLAKAVGDEAMRGEAPGTGAPAMFVFQLKDFQACIGGQLRLDHDRGRIDKYWNPAIAAWYPQGKDDPRLTLLRLDCADAQVWMSEAGPLRFVWEIARANASKTTPDLGERTHLDFH